MNQFKKRMLLSCLLLVMGLAVLAAQSYELTISNSHSGYKYYGDFSGIVYAPSYTITSGTPFSISMEPLDQMYTIMGCGGIYTNGYYTTSYLLDSWTLNSSTSLDPSLEPQLITVDSGNPQSTLQANWAVYIMGDSPPYEYIGRYCPPAKDVFVGDTFTTSYYLYLTEATYVDLSLTYDPALLVLNDIQPQIVITADSSTPGEIRVAGFGSAGYTRILSMTWLAAASGTVPMDTAILSFTDMSGNPLLINGHEPEADSAVFNLKQPYYPFGDVDGDQVVSIVDALKTAQVAVGLTVNGYEAEAADVNLDNQANIVDALIIAQRYVGIVSRLPLQ